MKYSSRDVVIGFVIIIIIIVGAFFYRRTILDKKTNLTSSTPVPIEFKKDFEQSFKYNISDDSSSIELKGDGRGIATNKEILADIENPEIGYFYQAWLQDLDGVELTSLGKLVEGKGGWMLEFPEISDTNNKKIIVSLERKFDGEMENKILEGSFK